MISSYSKIHQVGSRPASALFNGPILIEEKIDGSQFSFGMRDDVLHCRSRNQALDLTSAGQFQAGVDALLEIASELPEGWTYRGEYLQKPKHNVLAYEHTPPLHVVIYDICTEDGTWLHHDVKRDEAERLGMLCVPKFYYGPWPCSGVSLDDLLQTQSILGGPIEGVVFKNYAERDPTDPEKVLMAKYVTDRFRETMGVKRMKKPATDVSSLAAQFATQARWEKAVQHLRDGGKLTGTNADIGLLVREVQRDMLEESAEELKQALLDFFGKELRGGAVKGLPQWYQAKLLEESAA